LSNYKVSSSEGDAPMGSALAPVHHQFANDNSLHNLLRILTRRTKWIIGPIVICGFLATIVTFMTKPTYEATATIELNKSNGSLDMGLGDMLSQGVTGGADTLMTDMQTETTILQSDSLAMAVIEHLKLASQPQFAAEGSAVREEKSEEGLPLERSPRTRTRLLKLFGKYLKVQTAHGTRLIQVTYQSHDQEQAAQIANALIDAYKSQYLQSHYDATTETSEWLTKQLSDLKANVEASEQKLTEFEKESGILSLNTMMPTNSGKDSNNESGEIHSVIIQKLDALNAELTEAEANRIEKEAIYRLVQTGNEDVIVGIAGDSLAQQGKSMVLTQEGGVSNLEKLRQQQNLLKVNLAEVSATYGENNRHLKDIQTQLRALDEQIHEELQAITKRAQADFQLAKQTEGEIHRQFDQQQTEASHLNEKAVQFAVLSQEAFSRKRLYDDLYTKLQEANVSAGIKATNITLVNPARSQSVPVRPKHFKSIALGMLAGIFAGLVIAYAVDGFDRTVGSPLEVEELTGIPVISVIPNFDESNKAYGYGPRRRKEGDKKTAENPLAPNLVFMLAHPESAAAEAFRALRTSIMLSRAGGGPKVILVTSCVPGEGKTTVVTNLAVAFAQHNKNVIVVEADMRRPRMEHAFDVANTVGLSNVLAGTHTSDEAIVRGVQVPTLDVLPAGPHPPMPSEILGSAAFEELLSQLRLRYDIILIDSPPALLVTDPVSISMKSDATVWVSRAGIVTRPQLARATNIIDRVRMPVIGIVLNGMTKSVGGYGYGYDNYGSYYGRKESDDV
jgi:capsular exopolysaccharide synthesis family protein